MALSGSFDLLGKLRANLEQVSRVREIVARDAAPAIAADIDREFGAGQDPYGRAWAPLSPATLARGRRPPPLTATGAMRASLMTRSMSGIGIGLQIGGPASLHQSGTRRMPARPIFPADGLPEKWVAALRAATERAIVTVMAGGGK